MKQNKLWFRAKNYGWGWYPITWQGWLIVFLYTYGILKIALRAVYITKQTTNNTETFLWNYLPPIIVISAILIFICYKTGEKPEWRWKSKRIFK